MLTDSGYIKSARLIGSAFIIATTAFIWMALFFPPLWLRYGEMLAFALLSCFLANSALKRTTPKLLLMAIVVVIMAFVVLATTPVLNLSPYNSTRLGFLFAITIVSILWQRDVTGHGWRRKVLWGFVFAIVPPIFAPLHFLDSLGTGGLAFMLLPTVTGSCLCLWGTGTFRTDNSGGIEPKRTVSTWAGSASAIIVIAGVLYTVFPLGAYIIRLAFLFIRTITGYAIPIFLKPIIPLLDWIMNYLRDLINRLNSETEGYFQRYDQEPPREELEDGPTPIPALIFLYICLGILCVFILCSIWKAMNKYYREHQEEQVDEIKRDWSAGKALNWAANKVKDFASSAIHSVKYLFGRKDSEPSDPLVRLYAEFLQYANKAGQIRRPSQTPIEFSYTLSRAIPSAADPIISISHLYSKFYYSETPPQDPELSIMTKDLDIFKQAIEDLVKTPKY